MVAGEYPGGWTYGGKYPARDRSVLLDGDADELASNVTAFLHDHRRTAWHRVGTVEPVSEE